jgi:hypothetical protein
MSTAAKDSKRIRSKRILGVTIRRMIDESPDTSHLGEYSNRPKTEYAIDRAHSEDCASAQPREFEAAGEWGYWNGTAEGLLERIYDAIQRIDPSSDSYNEDEEKSLETLRELIDGFECDCGEHGDMGRNEFRYFNPSFNYVTKEGRPAEGLTPEDVRKYTRQDYDRMESLNAGNWCYIGIRAEAQVNVTGNLVQRITSGGLYGVESDSDRSYFAEVQADELANLKTELLALGFSKRAIAQAFQPDNVKEKDE